MPTSSKEMSGMGIKPTDPMSSLPAPPGLAMEQGPQDPVPLVLLGPVTNHLTDIEESSSKEPSLPSLTPLICP